MGVSELTNDPGERNNSRERLNGAPLTRRVHEQSKTTASAVKGGNRGAKGLARLPGYIYIFRVMEGYKGTNLIGFDGVTYSPAIATFSHSPWHRPAFDCKRDRATNEDAHCHPIAHPNDTARLQCALRPSQHPFTRCFMLMSWVLYPPRSPQLQLPPIAEDATGLLVHAFDLPPPRLHRLLADVRRRPHNVIMVFK